jgi:hypothetical protein
MNVAFFFLFVGVSAARESVSFNFGWRHRKGLHQAPNPPKPPEPMDCKDLNASFPTSKSGVECFGLTARAGPTDATSCASACCEDAACGLWQFRPGPSKSDGCWTGTGQESCSPNGAWVGGARKAPVPPDPPVNPDPGTDPPEAQPGFDDHSWQAVQLPHDALIASSASETACPDGCSGRSYIPRHVLWYRKTFTIPLAWKGSAVWLDFEGSFRNTTVWYNGKLVTSHECGYTPFRLHLSNLTAVRYGEPSLIAVFVDPDNGDAGGQRHGSGWWYEGGGLYRSVHLTRASSLHIEQDGLFAYSNLTWGGAASSVAVDPHPSGGVGGGDNPHSPTSSPTKGTVHASVALTEVGQPGSSAHAARAAAAAAACVEFSLISPDGETVLTSSGMVRPTVPPSGGSAIAKAALTIPHPTLWSAASPTLYTVMATVSLPEDGSSGCGPSALDGGSAYDALNVTHGFRSLGYDADQGFFLNGDHFKVRGFCDHNTFAVVGMAVPDRINLFRAQASRAIGGNGRRTSHNPPERAMLEIYDRVGIVVMDENRLFDNETKYVLNMGAMVKRDRNHPSVVIWSFCNEAGCEGSHETGGPRFREISYRLDGSRPTLANMFTFGDLLSNTIDVRDPACLDPSSTTTTTTRPLLLHHHHHLWAPACWRVPLLWFLLSPSCLARAPAPKSRHRSRAAFDRDSRFPLHRSKALATRAAPSSTTATRSCLTSPST